MLMGSHKLSVNLIENLFLVGWYHVILDLKENVRSSLDNLIFKLQKLGATFVGDHVDYTFLLCNFIDHSVNDLSLLSIVCLKSPLERLFYDFDDCAFASSVVSYEAGVALAS